MRTEPLWHASRSVKGRVPVQCFHVNTCNARQQPCMRGLKARKICQGHIASLSKKSLLRSANEALSWQRHPTCPCALGWNTSFKAFPHVVKESSVPGRVLSNDKGTHCISGQSLAPGRLEVGQDNAKHSKPACNSVIKVSASQISSLSHFPSLCCSLTLQC